MNAFLDHEYEESMTSKVPDATATEPNFASAEYAEQWRRGKRLRGEVFQSGKTKNLKTLSSLVNRKC